MVSVATKPLMSVRPPMPIRSAELPDGSLALIGAPMRFTRNAEVYGEDEPAEYLYQVISGGVRTYRMLDDGRRQVLAFVLTVQYMRHCRYCPLASEAGLLIAMRKTSNRSKLEGISRWTNLGKRRSSCSI